MDRQPTLLSTAAHEVPEPKGEARDESAILLRSLEWNRQSRFASISGIGADTKNEVLSIVWLLVGGHMSMTC